MDERPSIIRAALNNRLIACGTCCEAAFDAGKTTRPPGTYPNDFVHAVMEGQGVLFAGAGLSVPVTADVSDGAAL